jgi:hypothetical protein
MGRFCREAAAQIELAVAGDLVADHNHARAGHRRDSRIAANRDRHPVTVLGDHRLGQAPPPRT